MKRAHKQNHKQNEVKAKTSFVCPATDATNIFLAGTFNDWNPQSTPMKRASNGAWQIALELPPGRYEYKFVVDGQWCCEPGRQDAAGCPDCVRDERGIRCPNCVSNQFGTMNRVLEVIAGRTEQPNAARAA